MTLVWDGVLLIGGRVLLPVGIFLVILVAIVFFVGKGMKCLRDENLPILVVFCLLGAVIGLFTGNSRSPVVAGLLPAIVTFATAMVAYLATKDSLKTWRNQVPLHMIGLLVAVVFTAFYGAYLRGLVERQEEAQRRDLMHYEKVQLEVEKERLLTLVRSNASQVPPPTVPKVPPAGTAPAK